MNDAMGLTSRLTGDYGGRVYTLLVAGHPRKSWFVPYSWGSKMRADERADAIAKMSAGLASLGAAHLVSSEGYPTVEEIAP